MILRRYICLVKVNHCASNELCHDLLLLCKNVGERSKILSLVPGLSFIPFQRDLIYIFPLLIAVGGSDRFANVIQARFVISQCLSSTVSEIRTLDSA